jgi:hypothetical protein
MKVMEKVLERKYFKHSTIFLYMCATRSITSSSFIYLFSVHPFFSSSFPNQGYREKPILSNTPDSS